MAGFEDQKKNLTTFLSLEMMNRNVSPVDKVPRHSEGQRQKASSDSYINTPLQDTKVARKKLLYLQKLCGLSY